MERNDRVVLSLLGVVLCGMLWIGWQVQKIVPKHGQSPMTRTTEWTTPDGRLERFTSTRERGQAFDLFNEIHRQAVEELRNPR